MPTHITTADTLNQSATHGSPDTDTATTALHHTLGTGANQAAAGNHTHGQLHDAVTVADSTSIDLTLTGQQISAAAIFGTGSGTVAEGNHTHSSTYQPLDAQLTDLAALTYASNSLKVVRVNSGETAFELATLAGGGDVTGPASSVDSEIALFSSTTGKVIKRASTTGILKASSGVIAAAASGTDYAPATSGTSILKGNGSGGFSSATAGTDYPAVRVRNYSTADQGAGFASDTYVTGSSLLIPTGGMVAGMRFVWTITASKTAASTGTPAYTIRIGSNQSTADTSRLALTANNAQTAATDKGVLTVTAIVRNVGASGVIAGGAGWAARGGAAGFGGGASAASSTFDNSSLGGQYIGLSINGGTSSAWTINSVYAELTP